MAKYDENIKEQIALLVEEGHSVSSICKITGIGRRTFYEWKNRHQDFAEMLEEAEQQRIEELHELANKALRKKLNGYYQTVSRTVYTPSEDESETLNIKQHTVTRKYCEPDTALLLEVLGYRTNKTKRKRNLAGKGVNPVLVVKKNEAEVQKDIEEVPPFTLKAKEVVENDLSEPHDEPIKTDAEFPIVEKENTALKSPVTVKPISQPINNSMNSSMSRPINKPTENLPPGYTHRA